MRYNLIRFGGNFEQTNRRFCHDSSLVPMLFTVSTRDRYPRQREYPATASEKH